MIYQLLFTKGALASIRKIKKSSPAIFKKIQALLDDIMDHPRTGIGHPEPLVGGGDTRYSRHIRAFQRILYEIDDERVTVLVVEVEGHYNDK